MERTEYYQSLSPNTNPNGNGKPAVLKVIIGTELVRMIVTIEAGSAMNGAGSIITLSDTTVPRHLWDLTKNVILANTVKLES